MYSKIFWVAQYRWYGRSRLSVPKKLSTQAFLLQVASNCWYFVAAYYRRDPSGVGARPWCPFASSMVRGLHGKIHGLTDAYSPADREARVESEDHAKFN